MNGQTTKLGIVLITVLASLPGCQKGGQSNNSPTTKEEPRNALRSSKAPATYFGFLDLADTKRITGWAWDRDQPDVPIKVDIYDGTTLLATVVADQFRQDLYDKKFGNGKHRFVYYPPAQLKDGKEHSIHAKFSGFETELNKSPKVLKVEEKAPSEKSP